MNKRFFLGVDLPNWIAIIGVTITIFIIFLGASSKVSTLEEKTNRNVMDINECKIEIKKSVSSISDIKGDVKEINGKLDILINRR